MSSFGDFILDKTVALVGPAQYMQGSGFGDEIDSNDVVVRVNRGIESIEDYENDVGSITDVYYTSLIQAYTHTGFLDPEELSDKYLIQHICCPPHSDFSGIANETCFHELVNLNDVEAIQKHIPIRIIDHQFHTELAKSIMCKPNTGYLSIYDLLRFSPKKLSIYGFSFYLDGFIEGAKAGVETEQNMNQNDFAKKVFGSKRHVQENMWEHSRRMVLNNPIVDLDPILFSILNMPTFDRKYFEDNIRRN